VSGKLCPKCSVLTNNFGANRARKDGLQTYCRECMRAYASARGYDKERWEANREAESERNRKYRTENAERLQAYHRDKKRAYRAENPAKVRANNIARKHGERRATPAWADRAAMNAIYGRAKELQSTDGIERHVDHVIPLKHPMVCGLHVPANLQVLTAAENMSKKNKLLESSWAS
jgi:hypothetical protein